MKPSAVSPGRAEKQLPAPPGLARELVSSATTTLPKNALLLMRCRSAPQNHLSPLTSRFPVAAPSPTKDAPTVEIATASWASPSPCKAQKAAAMEAQHEERQEEMVAVQEQDEAREEDDDER
ncbi:hypothetical protein E2562_024023 [Oryza meyeriana var. granulata]|uniref:Uncharacterized protein n=1 Tax=Oryza meyeriana var. granulata TaxID=110450 RepID=A0A6G1CSH9_9ORYZ|nr:hypothetical protein E2562_024023 [Oryza meyeriana var. granulata]